MKLVLIVGDGAVGKMTVGQDLMKITDLRLFHNHMTIEPVLEIFNDFNGVYMKSVGWDAKDKTWTYKILIYTK